MLLNAMQKDPDYKMDVFLQIQMCLLFWQDATHSFPSQLRSSGKRKKNYAYGRVIINLDQKEQIHQLDGMPSRGHIILVDLQV